MDYILTIDGPLHEYIQTRGAEFDPRQGTSNEESTYGLLDEDGAHKVGLQVISSTKPLLH